MEVTDIIRRRRSCREFESEQPVAGEVLEQIVEAGRVAPSACNNQPWRFLVVSEPTLRGRIAACYQGRWLAAAPHILIVVADREAAWVRSDGYSSVETDATIAMDHMILAAESLGVATCWIAAFSERELRRVLALRDHEYVFAITPLGYALHPERLRQQKAKRKTLQQVVTFI